MAERAKNPLHGAAPVRVPLPKAPLIKVVAQIRFAVKAELNADAGVLAFRAAILPRYPVEQHQQQLNVVMLPGQPLPFQNTTKLWRFTDPSGIWAIALTHDFLALETNAYTERADLFDRIGDLLRIAHATLQPIEVTRMGLRYVDRIAGMEFARLPELVYPDVGGLAVGELSGDVAAVTTEALLSLADLNAVLRLRWALVPEGLSYDAAAIAPIPARSWVLDLDAFGICNGTIEVEKDAETFRSYADRIYRVFRWSVTDEFLRTFGAA